MLRLAVGQMEPRINEMDGNLRRMKTLLDSATKENVDVLVLPECVNSGYAFESKEEALALSEEIPTGTFSKELKKWSKGEKMVVAGLTEEAQEGLFDSAVIFTDGKYITTYRKIHLYDKEKKWFIPGDKEPPIVEYRGYRFGTIICIDWAYPEITRVLALRGAQILSHPANLLFSYSRRAMITRSIENRIFTATATRVGEERGLRFIGGSQITDPRGHILINMDEIEEGIAWIDIDPAVADNKAIGRSDVIKDRRPELYDRISET